MMKHTGRRTSLLLNNWIFTLLLLIMITAQAPAQYTPTPNDTLVSVSVLPDNRAILRVYAPKAADVRIGGSDIPEVLRSSAMVKQATGVWEATIGPLVPGAYRYTFIIDGVTVLDPRNSAMSESNDNTWSLMYVPGAEFMEMKHVPHGAVSEVTYYSEPLGRFRRMHVYTPPGYASGGDSYPVLYLLHGAYDCDDAWTTVGRAGLILDNLIAEHKAVPMLVVMPAGHTGPFGFGMPMQRVSKTGREEFIEDFVTNVRP